MNLKNYVNELFNRFGSNSTENNPRKAYNSKEDYYISRGMPEEKKGVL